MLFTHMADPDRDDAHYVDGDDYTYETAQGEVPGVSALAGLDPADDLQRENGELRAALLLSLEEWRRVAYLARRQATKLAELIDR